MGMTKSNFVKLRPEMSYYFRSRMFYSRPTVFVLIGFGLISIIYGILYFQGHSPKFTISFSHVSTMQNSLSPYSRVHHETLIPKYEKVADKRQPPATCLFIIRDTDGGFGNRMFLFASAYGLARLHQCDLYVAPFILTELRAIFVLNITNTPVNLITNDSFVNRTDITGRYSACTLFDDLFKIPLAQNLTVHEFKGFYQAYGYFIKYKYEINYLYQFNADVIEKNIPLVEQLVKAVWNIPLDLGNYTKYNVPHQYLKNILTRPPAPLIPVTWIGIHIRRGDFLTFFKIDTSMAYLTWAMNYYRRKYVNCRFLIASDDKKFVKENLGSLTDVFITPESFFSGHDFGALALCDHTIVTAGTYGWWAAWLTGGDVIHDLNYPVPSQNCVHKDYFPPWFLFPYNSSSQTQN